MLIDGYNIDIGDTVQVERHPSGPKCDGPCCIIDAFFPSTPGASLMLDVVSQVDATCRIVSQYAADHFERNGDDKNQHQDG